MPLTRSEDAPGNEERVRKIRGEGRRRTLVLSIVAAGVTSLFIGNVFERTSYNAQAERSRENCRGLQKLAQNLHEVATDVSEQSPESETRTRWSGYAQDFSLIYPPNGKTCEQIFPKRSVIPFTQ